jgi:hypothetical protein
MQSNEEDYFDNAFWHAQSQPPVVREFELFASDQPGVSVLFFDESRLGSDELFIDMRASDGWRYGVRITLDKIESGQVATLSGWGSWEEYMRKPSASFGCT